MSKNKQPEQLRRGNKFHKNIQDNWKKTAEGEVKPERTILKQSSRKGRVDIFVDDEDAEGVIAIKDLFDEEGIPVVWDDESIEECKKRKH